MFHGQKEPGIFDQLKGYEDWRIETQGKETEVERWTNAGPDGPWRKWEGTEQKGEKE